MNLEKNRLGEWGHSTVVATFFFIKLKIGVEGKSDEEGNEDGRWDFNFCCLVLHANDHCYLMVASSLMHHQGGNHPRYPSTRGSKLAQILKRKDKKERFDDARNKCNGQHAIGLCNPRHTIKKPLLVSSRTISTASCSSAYTKDAEYLLRDEKVEKIENESVRRFSYPHQEESSEEEMEPSPSMHSEENLDKIEISGLQRRAYLLELRNEKFKKKSSAREGKMDVVDTKSTHNSNLIATVEDIEGISKDEKDSLLCMSDDLFSDSSYCLSNDLDKDHLYRQINLNIPHQSCEPEAFAPESESSKFVIEKSLFEENEFKQQYQGTSDYDYSNEYGTNVGASSASESDISRQKPFKHTLEQRRAYLRDLRTKIYNRLDIVGAEKGIITDSRRTKKPNLKATVEDEEGHEKDSLLCMSNDSLSDTLNCVSNYLKNDYGYKMILNSPQRPSEVVMTENGLSSSAGSNLAPNRENENLQQYRQARDSDDNDSSGGHVKVRISSASKSTISHKKRFDHALERMRKETAHNPISVSQDTGPNVEHKVARPMHRKIDVNEVNISPISPLKSVTLGENQDGYSRYTSATMNRARDIVYLRKQSPRMAIHSRHNTRSVSCSNLRPKGVEVHYPTHHTPELFSMMQQQQQNGRQEQEQQFSFAQQQSTMVPTTAQLTNENHELTSVHQETQRRVESQQLREQQSVVVPGKHNHSHVLENYTPNRMQTVEQEAQKRMQQTWCRKYPPFRPLEHMNVGVINYEIQQDVSDPSNLVEINGAIREVNDNDNIRYKSSYSHYPVTGDHNHSPMKFSYQQKNYCDGDQEEIVQFNKIIHPSCNREKESIRKRMHRAKKWGQAKERKRGSSISVDTGESSFHSGSNISRRTNSSTLVSTSLSAPDPKFGKKKYRNEKFDIPRYQLKNHDDDIQSNDRRNDLDGPRRRKVPELVVEISDRTNFGMATIMDAGDGIEVGYETSQDSRREKHSHGKSRSIMQFANLTTSSSVSTCSKSTENESVTSEQSDSTTDSFTFVDSSDSTFEESSERDLAQKFWSLFV